MSSIKFYNYSIDQLGLHNIIMLSRNTSYDDIKIQIASKIGISDDELYYTSVPTIIPAFLYDDQELKLEIHKKCKDIDIMIHNNKKITIKEGYKITIDDFFKLLKKDGLYYSKNCKKNNFHIFSSGNEIKDKEYPFLSANQTSDFKVLLDEKIIELNFDKKQFFFSDSDYLSNVYKLIQKVFHLNGNLFDGEKEMISIKSSQRKLKSYLYLNPREKYKVNVIRSYLCFKDVDKNKRNEFFWVNYYASVSDVKNKLFEIFKISYDLNIPDRLILYDENKNLITNSL